MLGADPLRRCVGCRQLFPRSQLWRLVRQFDSHQVLLDQGMGRSAYVCRRLECLQAARRKQQMSRALKAPVPDSVFQRLEQQLLRDSEAQGPWETSPPEASASDKT
ncbi:YlxR family protein [Synechococcus sp. H55.2]|uniref:YlxR family protein n=1 Tax=unclassified Synechococcus TaxID=2626047 RepID=UPI0039C45251